MKKSKENFESISKFSQVQKDQLGYIVGGKFAAIDVTLGGIYQTGPDKLTDVRDLD